MKIECFSKRRQDEAERVRVEESGWIRGRGTAIKDVVVIGVRTREDFYGQGFWVCDPLEWPRAGAGSLKDRSGQGIRGKFGGGGRTEYIGEREENGQYAGQQHTGGEEERGQSSFC